MIHELAHAIYDGWFVTGMPLAYDWLWNHYEIRVQVARVLCLIAFVAASGVYLRSKCL